MDESQKVMRRVAKVDRNQTLDIKKPDFFHSSCGFLLISNFLVFFDGMFGHSETFNWTDY